MRILTMEIIEFYGHGCPDCARVEPFVKKLKKEGFDIKQIEIWHSEENKKLMKKIIGTLLNDFNSGNESVPAFYSSSKPRERQLLIEPSSYEEIKEWIES
jgi:glutaredoxin-related protein